MSTKKEISKLEKMDLNKLQSQYAEVIGKKTRSPNRKFLVAKIAEALQAAGNRAGEKKSSPTTTSAAESPVAANATATTASAVEPVAETATERLTDLTVPELRTRYLEVVGQSTGSSNAGYLRWKIAQAKKGRITIGPRKNAQREDVAFKVLPLRMEAAVVDKLDEAWKRQGLHSRTDLFRRSLLDYLASVGESEVAALLADTAVEKS